MGVSLCGLSCNEMRRQMRRQGKRHKTPLPSIWRIRWRLKKWCIKIWVWISPPRKIFWAPRTCGSCVIWEKQRGMSKVDLSKFQRKKYTIWTSSFTLHLPFEKPSPFFKAWRTFSNVRIKFSEDICICNSKEHKNFMRPPFHKTNKTGEKFLIYFIFFTKYLIKKKII